jgi:hypothetical protein
MEKRCEHFIHPKVELLSSGTATCNIRLTCNTSQSDTWIKEDVLPSQR